MKKEEIKRFVAEMTREAIKIAGTTMIAIAIVYGVRNVWARLTKGCCEKCEKPEDVEDEGEWEDPDIEIEEE